MSTANSSNSGALTLTPLRQWIEGVDRQRMSARPRNNLEHAQQRRERILRTTTVAYGMAEMLRRARSHCGADFPSYSPACENSRWGIHNFAVRSSTGEISTWKDIKGVDMLSPRLSMYIVEPAFLCNDAEQEDQMGRYLEVHFPTLPEDAEGAATAVSQSEEDDRCHALGAILYELFSHISILKDDGSPGGNSHGSQQPAHKKTRLLESPVIPGKEAISPAKVAFAPSVSSARQVPICQKDDAKQHLFSQKSRYVPLVDLGFPSSISLLVQNLLECGVDNRPDDAYDSLDAVSKDLHLLLLDPPRFLFDREIPSGIGRVQLSFRKHTLYGREKEVSLITDAFCRVSAGKCEAFFVGGFSGSGKSRLVNSLTARVDVCEGYVITHKFDQMSKEKCLLEVVAVINDLCLLIRKKRTQQDLHTLANSIAESFGTNFSMLAQLLPHAVSLSPSRQNPTTEGGSGIRLNLESVCFLLARFMRLVSSKAHPVMLFLDDLQWCDKSALTLIENILCDSIGSSCFFFVGSYRSNEVEKDHNIFHLIDSLSSHGTPTTQLNLEGLTPEDLNNMMSDALGIFPRISEPLSDIVFQKTKGNPFFAMGLLESLIDGGLLEYNICQRRWMWDEECISSMDITSNVLYLLSSKMSELSKNVQLALKVASCFGIKIKETIVNYLSQDSKYYGMLDGLKHLVKDGFMIKLETSEFRFVHDRIREAAYTLIPKSEKKKYHYSLGMALYSKTKGSNAMIDLAFSITDQINYIDSSEVPHESKLGLAKLNEISGVNAMDLSDYVTARSYLNTTLALLPADHWERHYDLSLQSHFLLAKSAYSSGDSETSYDVLQNIILRNARCLSDKLEAYNLVVVILYDRGELQGAYMKSCEVLSELGESIPDETCVEEMKEITKSTSKMLRGLSEESLLGTKEMESKEQFILKFYLHMSIVAFHANSSRLPSIHFRIIQLSMKHGICKHSLLGLVQHAALVCLNSTLDDDIQEACRIGKLAMTRLGQFNSATDIIPRICHIYYGMVAIYSEPVQSSVDSLRKGFECGISSGDTTYGLMSAINHLSKCLIAGTNLTTLLKRTNYYLEVTKTHNNKMARKSFLLFRETISILMGKKCNTCPEDIDTHQGVVFHKAIRAFWIGHHERSHHFADQIIHGKIPGYRNHRIMVMLYYGLNPFKVKRKTGGLNTKEIPRKVLKTLKAAAKYSEWNFRNKVHLLAAEIFSCDKKNDKAKASYAAAILSAQCSRFIHEEGLACERAGLHYKNIGDYRAACGLLNQAKQCYENWGSHMKADSITHQLRSFQI